MGSKVHYFYVNGQYQGDDAIGQLVHDFWCIKASEMSLSWLRERTQYLKETAEGLRHVSSLFDELRAEGEQKGDLKRMLETARRMIVKGCYASDEIVDISGLSHDKVQELLAQFKSQSQLNA